MNEYDVSKKFEDRSMRRTSITAEIRAGICALEQALDIVQKNPNKYKQISIYTDSIFLVNAMNSWINVWIKNNWKTTKYTPVKNRDLFIKLLDSCSKFSNGELISWNHVKGHAKNFYNNKAHSLATEAVVPAIQIIEKKTKKKNFALKIKKISKKK